MEVTAQEAIEILDVATALGGPIIRDPGGWHVTDLLKLAENTAKKSRAKDYSDIEGVAGLGCLWEAAVRPYVTTRLAQDYGANFIASVTLTLEDILGNLDGVALAHDAERIKVIEIKTRWGNEIGRDNFDVGSQTLWLRQGKAYCKLTNTPEIIYVVMKMQARPPSVFGYWIDVEFTQQEIDENWQMIRNTKEWAIAQGMKGSAG